MKRYCSSQHQNYPPFWCQLGGTVLHILWCYLFIHLLGLHIYGAIISYNITSILQMVGLKYWIHRSKEFELTRVPFDERTWAFEELP